MSGVVYRQVIIVDLDGVRFRFHPFDFDDVNLDRVSPELCAWFRRYGSWRYLWGYPRYVR